MRPSLNLLMERAKFTNGEILGCLESCVIIIDLIRHKSFDCISEIMDKLVNEGVLSKIGRDSYNINRQKVVI